MAFGSLAPDDEAALAQQAREAAAARTSRSVRPEGGRQEGPMTGFVHDLIFPQTPLDLGLMALGGPLSRGAKAGALALGGMLTSSEAEAGGATSLLRRAGSFVRDPLRVFAPGIYKNPRVIAEEAAANVAPENPAMRQLFGVTRDDLWEIGGRGRRPGNIDPVISTADNPRGSYAAEAIMTPRNARRLTDALGEAERHPALTRGMDSWYVMDPAYQRMVELMGADRAPDAYRRFNNITSMFSPGSDVLTEINRGTAAHMMATRGEFDQFLRHGGTAAQNRGANFPAALRDVQGHPYHSTSQAGSAANYLDTGVVNMQQPKVPLYMQASGVPETGFQTRLPVPDAHFTRAIGMSDVRRNADPGAAMRRPEYAAVGPWFRENVATPVGLEAVPAQARLWGLMGRQTGVDTPVGAPKLELLAQAINDRATRLGIDPALLRDHVLTGRAHAAWLLPALAPVGMAATGMGDPTAEGAPGGL